MGFSGQGYWSGVAILFYRRIFPTRGSSPCLLHWQADFLPLSHLGKPQVHLLVSLKFRLGADLNDLWFWYVEEVFPCQLGRQLRDDFGLQSKNLGFSRLLQKQVISEPFIVQSRSLSFFFFGIIFWSYELCFSALIQLPYRCILPEGPDLEDLCPVYL